jgi:hypothetical protein
VEVLIVFGGLRKTMGKIIYFENVIEGFVKPTEIGDKRDGFVNTNVKHNGLLASNFKLIARNFQK